VEETDVGGGNHFQKQRKNMASTFCCRSLAFVFKRSTVVGETTCRQKNLLIEIVRHCDHKLDDVTDTIVWPY